MPQSLPRWVRARQSGFAHLDLGDRSALSLRVFGENVIVTACRAHLAPDAEVVPDSHLPRCSNCVRIISKLVAAAVITLAMSIVAA